MVGIPPLAAINLKTGSKRAPDLRFHMTCSALAVELQYLVLPQMFRSFLGHAALKGNVPGPWMLSNSIRWSASMQTVHATSTQEPVTHSRMRQFRLIG